MLLLSFLVGVAGLLGVVLALALGSDRGPALRRASRELSGAVLAPLLEIGTPDEQRRVPRREATRRRGDSVHDLAVALGGGVTAQEQAESDAYDEAAVRTGIEEERRLRVERQRAYERSMARQQRTRDEAVRQSAATRASWEVVARAAGPRQPEQATRGNHVSLAGLEETVAAQRRAAHDAMLRREEAEHLAEEAMARAARERAAADEVQRSREAAERAAEEALARAERELRTAGAASQARRTAEEQAQAAAAVAASERAAAEAAVARRRAAESRAADAEAAQDAAVHRELAALEAAEAAEEARREAAARQAGTDTPLDLREVDLRPVDLRAAERSSADLRTTRSAAVSSAADTPGRSPLVARAEAGPVAVAGGSNGTAPPPFAPPPFATAAVSGAGPAVGGPDASPPERPERPEPPEPPEHPVELGPPEDDAMAGRGRALVSSARAVALLVVPAAVAGRTAVAGAWWSGMGAGGAAVLAAAAVLTALGVRWTWVANTPPYALRRRTARRIVAAEQLQQAQTAEAARLLDAVGTTGDDGAWEEFEARTGLVVPGGTRTVVDPGMDPAALVRYLTARQRDAMATPAPLVVVALVPLVLTLLPAALLVLAA